MRISGTLPKIRFAASPNPDAPNGNLQKIESDEPQTGGLKKTAYKIPKTVGTRLMMTLVRKQKAPISVFITTKGAGPMTADQQKQLTELGLTINHIAGNINTGRIIDLDKFDTQKLDQLDFLVQIEAAAQLRPN